MYGTTLTTCNCRFNCVKKLEKVEVFCKSKKRTNILRSWTLSVQRDIEMGQIYSNLL